MFFLMIDLLSVRAGLVYSWIVPDENQIESLNSTHQVERRVQSVLEL